MKAIEVTGTVDEQRNLRLDAALPTTGPSRVRVIILFPDGDDIPETSWLKAASASPAFDFLREEAEDIYSPTDGKSFHD